jgi:hypothetical protein
MRRLVRFLEWYAGMVNPLQLARGFIAGAFLFLSGAISSACWFLHWWH